MFKSLSAVVFMMISGCVSEPVTGDQTTGGVAQTPDVTVVTGAAVVDATVTASTSCVDGSTNVNGVCVNAQSAVEVVDATVTTQQPTAH